MIKFFLVLTLLLTVPLKGSNPALERHLFLLRHPETNRQDFRNSLKKVGEYLGFQMARDLESRNQSITTCMGEKAVHTLSSENLVLVTILRGGMPLLEGLIEVFPHAEIGFLAAKRNEETLKPTIFYEALPALEGKTVCVMDTMIATGGSVLGVLETIQAKKPRKIVVVGAIFSEKGLKKIQDFDKNILIYAGAIDPILNEKGYILPGLGDAGDRAYGPKDVLENGREMEEGSSSNT